VIFLDERLRKTYNRHRKKVLPVNGQPRILTTKEISRLKLVARGGFSYARNAAIQIVTRKTNDKKS